VRKYTLPVFWMIRMGQYLKSNIRVVLSKKTSKKRKIKCYVLIIE